MSTFTPIIGLEIHVELNTKTKMFCGCPANHFDVKPNTHICPVCYGLPGALPIANEEGIRRTIKIGLALGSNIAKHSKFDRKNYFYPDLPKGYQISQYDQPLCAGGRIITSGGEVGITRVHLEEDTAKIQHVTLTDKEMSVAGVHQAAVSLIDFNRSGVPLVEIVTEPDIHSAEQAREFAKNLVHILRYLDVSDCDMEKGALRLEANISVQTPAEKEANKLPPYKVEVKNLNSFRFLERAITFEIERHSQLRQQGELPVQETRGWNDDAGRSYAQRSKEEAEDYRYFPDPDLAELEISQNLINELKSELPELPLEKKNRLITDYQLSEQNAEVLVSSKKVAAVLEQLLVAAAKLNLNYQDVANAVVNKKVDTWLVDEDQVNAAKPAEIEGEVKRTLDLLQKLLVKADVSESEIGQAIDQVLQDPSAAEAVRSYRDGKLEAIGFLLGKTRQYLPPKVDMQQVKNELEKQLKELNAK